MKPSLHHSIANTLDYAQFFDYQLTTEELHHWLITPKPVSKNSFEVALKSLNKKDRSRFTHKLSKTRHERLLLTNKKLLAVKQVIELISLIPTIRLVALTGSLSVDNAKPDDDIDLMIVTSSNTLWITRLLTTFIIVLMGKKRPPGSHATHYPNTICTNLWLETSSLKVPSKKANLYTAHEVLQIRPIIDRGNTYQHFLTQNSWSSGHLANAYSALVKPSDFKTDLAILLLLSPLNFLAYILQLAYMRSKITQESVSLHSAYFHPRNISSKINDFLKYSS